MKAGPRPAGCGSGLAVGYGSVDTSPVAPIFRVWSTRVFEPATPMLPLCSMKGVVPTHQSTPNPNAAPQFEYANPFESFLPFWHEAGGGAVELNMLLAAE